MSTLTTREKIIELSRDLIQAAGYHSFNYKLVSTQLNIKNASIHHYFPSKEDLALAVIEKDTADFKRFAASVSARTPTQKILAMADNYIQYFRNGRKLCVVSTFGTSYNDISDRIRNAASGYASIIDTWFKDTFREGLETGEFTFTETLESLSAFWMASLPGALIVGRIHGASYFNIVMDRLKSTLKN